MQATHITSDNRSGKLGTLKKDDDDDDDAVSVMWLINYKNMHSISLYNINIISEKTKACDNFLCPMNFSFRYITFI